MASDAGDSRVYPCLLAPSQTRPQYLRIRATEGVIAPGRRVQVRIGDTWRTATVVTPWAESSLGSVVYLELGRE
jgi:hypothetical protein